jgi:hypothetical protein
MNQKQLKALRDQFEEQYRHALESFIDTHTICAIGDIVEDGFGNYYRVTKVTVSHRLELDHPWLYQTEYAHATDLIEYRGIRTKPDGELKGRKPYEVPIQPSLVVHRAYRKIESPVGGIGKLVALA